MNDILGWFLGEIQIVVLKYVIHSEKGLKWLDDIQRKAMVDSSIHYVQLIYGFITNGGF